MSDFANSLSGYRTIIFLVISLVLKILVMKGTLSSTVGEKEANAVTDLILLGASFISDASALWFRMRAEKPGPLSVAAKRQRDWEENGSDRRNRSDTVTDPSPKE